MTECASGRRQFRPRRVSKLNDQKVHESYMSYYNLREVSEARRSESEVMEERKEER